MGRLLTLLRSGAVVRGRAGALQTRNISNGCSPKPSHQPSDRSDLYMQEDAQFQCTNDNIVRSAAWNRHL